MQCHVPPMSTTPIGENLTFDHFKQARLKVKGAESRQSSSFCQYIGTLIYRANLYITKSLI